MVRKIKEPTPQAEMTQNISISSELADASENSAHNPSRCGGALRLERENQKLTIQDIASRLRLSSKQIEAIEADNFSSLPEATIVRGFIRNYAKQLKINAEPLLDAYNVLVPSSIPYELTVKPTSKMKVTAYTKPKTGRYIWAGLIILMGLGVWLFYLNYVEKPNPTKPVASVNSMEPLPEAALPAAERASEPQMATELKLPPADNSAPQAPPASANANTSNATPANVQPLPAPEANVASNTLPTQPPAVLPSNGMAQLEFNASQETWVSVVDATGKEFFNKTIFAGSRESIDITPPVKVTVGNAGGISMSMNGKPVDLAPHSRNNIAHIKLE
jgi:cytoskeleton protein RodZ